MTISELIERLEALKADHGDLPVVYSGDGSQWTPDPDVVNLDVWSHQHKTTVVQWTVVL